MNDKSRASTVQRPVRTLNAAGRSSSVVDELVVEEPLEIRLGFGPLNDRRSQSIAVTMRTPGADDALALGFLFAEGLINDRGEVRSVGPCGDLGPDLVPGNIVRVELEMNVDPPPLHSRHSFVSSSCGVCGKRTIEELRQLIPAGTCESRFSIGWEALRRAARALRGRQPLFTATGAIHAAAAVDHTGELGEVYEDVGRHNALDKLLGAAFERGDIPLDSAVLVSGRIGFELVQKVARAGCPVLVGVGGASSLAVDAAQALGVTVIGFFRDGGGNLYTHPDRIGG